MASRKKVASEPGIALDLDGIQRLIPHRYPVLMIDRVVDLIPNESVTGIKCVTIGEPYFQGHFPVKAVMPGVYIIEAMAQSAAVMIMYSLGLEHDGKIVYFMSIKDAKFRKPVVPGDVLYLYITEDFGRRNVWRFKGMAKVDGQIVAEAVFSAMLADAE